MMNSIEVIDAFRERVLNDTLEVHVHFTDFGLKDSN